MLLSDYNIITTFALNIAKTDSQLFCQWINRRKDYLNIDSCSK